MKRTFLAISALGLAWISAPALASDGAKLAEGCVDCHEFAYDFEGLGADELNSMITAQLENAKHKATQGMSAEDVKALADYIAAEVAK
jgi:cytochrome c553